MKRLLSLLLLISTLASSAFSIEYVSVEKNDWERFVQDTTKLNEKYNTLIDDYNELQQFNDTLSEQNIELQARTAKLQIENGCLKRDLYIVGGVSISISICCIALAVCVIKGNK